MKFKFFYILFIIFITSIACKTTRVNKLYEYDFKILDRLDGGYIMSIYKIERFNQWHSLKFKYFNRQEIVTIEKPILKDKNNKKYIELNKENFYLEWTEAPVLISNGIESDICCELRKIEFAINKMAYGDPPAAVHHNVKLVLFIDSTGKLDYYGFYMPCYYGIYERAVLNIFEQGFKFKPAKLNGKDVGSIYKIYGIISLDGDNEFKVGWLFQNPPAEVIFPKLDCSKVF